MLKKYRALSKNLHIAGSILIAIVVILAIPFTLPRAFGIQIYRIETNSMEPEYPVGSIVYVKAADPDELQIGDVITFRQGTNSNEVVTHRIDSINSEGDYVTKGDNNADVDLTPVCYERIDGRVVLGVRLLGYIAPVFQNLWGKIFVVVLLVMATILWVYSDLLKKKVKKLSSEENKSAETSETAELEERPKMKFDFVTLGLVLTGVGLMVYGASQLLSINLNYKKTNEVYNQIEESYVTKNTLDETENNSDSQSSQSETEWYHLIDVDFDGLCAANPDTIAWLYFEDGEISYPVMYSGDNTKYYHTNFSLDYDSAGCIFMEKNNTPDFSDSNTFIYGHNMLSLAMFGKLKYYRLYPGYYKEHQYFIIETPNVAYRYQIFAYEEVKDNSSMFQIFREPSEAFGQYLDSIHSQSYIQTDIPVTENDPIITLVTCNGVKDERFLIHAVRVDLYSK